MFIDIDLKPADAEKSTYTEAETDGERPWKQMRGRYKVGQQSSLI